MLQLNFLMLLQKKGKRNGGGRRKENTIKQYTDGSRNQTLRGNGSLPQQNKQIAMTNFLDIEGAFNSARTDSLVEALASREIRVTLYQQVKASLENRVVISITDEATLVAKPGRGCPQADQPNSKLLDELSSCRGPFLPRIRGRSGEPLVQLRKTSINAMKCQFYKKTNLRELQPVRLTGLQILMAKEAKYVGGYLGLKAHKPGRHINGHRRTQKNVWSKLGTQSQDH